MTALGRQCFVYNLSPPLPIFLPESFLSPFPQNFSGGLDFQRGASCVSAADCFGVQVCFLHGCCRGGDELQQLQMSAAIAEI